MKMNKIKFILCLILSVVMLLSVVGISAVASNSPYDEESDLPDGSDVPEDHNHSFSDWQPIPGNVSQHVRHCECGKVEHENCSLDGGVVTTKPTQNSTGVMTYTCKVCGGTKTEKIDKLTSDKTNQNDGDKGDKNNEDDKSNIWIIPVVIAIVAALGTVVCGVLIYKKKFAEKNADKTDSSDDIKDKVNEE